MSTVLIVVALVVLVALVGAALYWRSRSRNDLRRPALQKRFGPEYDLTLARHDGNHEAADRELAGRVERYGRLRPRPLTGEERERYETRWAELQQRFVDAPREAVAEAGELLAGLAEERGYPAANAYEEQMAALSVHHAHSLDAYRRVRRAARPEGTGANTEQLRTALLEARQLFEELSSDRPRHQRRDARRHEVENGRHHRPSHLPRSLKPKGSGVR
ncbi:hypothetical protein ACIRD2_27940 [Streptomyces sp. NPDC093595]|uniref:hypothetical protein n=1 Tax=Streptomyces sp. NPDC093595 TaxID=3366045 RepID=UPI00382C1340